MILLLQCKRLNSLQPQFRVQGSSLSCLDVWLAEETCSDLILLEEDLLVLFPLKPEP